jgi:hypothetical protein
VCDGCKESFFSSKIAFRIDFSLAGLCRIRSCLYLSLFIGLSSDPDPGFNIEADLDPGSQIKADPDPGFNIDVDLDLGSQIKADPDPGFNIDTDFDPGSQIKANPDPGFNIDTDLDPGSQINADPGRIPDQALPSHL